MPQHDYYNRKKLRFQVEIEMQKNLTKSGGKCKNAMQNRSQGITAEKLRDNGRLTASQKMKIAALCQ